MAKTIEEALKEAEERTAERTEIDIYEEIEINEQTRDIFIPQSEKLFGVESDERAERKHFVCPRYVGDHIDLSELSVRINYRNANNETDVYIVDDVEVMEEGAPGGEIEEVITFSWLLSRKVTRYKGAIQFIVCAVRSVEGNIKNEWNTTLGTGQVLEGLEAEVDVTPEEKDVLQQLINIASESASIADKAAQDATQAVSEANELKRQLESLIQRAQEIVNNIGEMVPDVPVTFVPADASENIQSGDTIRESFRKVHDVFEELGEAATYDVAGSFEEITEQVEAVPHARLVKRLQEKGYEDLTGKPSINNVLLEGNKSLEDIGVIKAITDIINDGAKLKYQVLDGVSSLPDPGEPGVIYLIPPDEVLAGEPVIENKFMEYMYVIDHYEVIGEVSAEQLVADAELSLTSENPVQNKVITQRINDISGNVEENRTLIDTISEQVASIILNKIDVSKILTAEAESAYVDDTFLMSGKKTASLITQLNGKLLIDDDCKVSVGSDENRVYLQAMKYNGKTLEKVLQLSYNSAKNKYVLNQLYSAGWDAERTIITTSDLPQWLNFTDEFGSLWITGMLQSLLQAENYKSFEYSNNVSHEGGVVIFKRTNDYSCSGIFIPGAEYANSKRIFIINGIPNVLTSWKYKEII